MSENQGKDNTSMSFAEAKKTVSSAQRLHEAEQKIRQLSQNQEDQLQVIRTMVLRMGELQEKIENLSQTASDLGRRLDTIVSVYESNSTLSKQLVQDSLVEQKVQELTANVEKLKQNNLIVQDGDEVKENSFVVIEERTKDGQLISPRTQFILSNMTEEIKTKLMGQKVGDSVSLGDDKNTVILLEVYQIVQKEEASGEDSSPTEQ